jgi:hypothetical protein
MAPQPVIYVAGKYRGKSESEVLHNIIAAREEAVFIWSNGGIALTPHMNTALMGGICPDENFLSGDLNLLVRCDAVYAIPYNWHLSSGAMAEVALARLLGIPVLEGRDEVLAFIKGASVNYEGGLRDVFTAVVRLLQERPFPGYSYANQIHFCPDCSDGDLRDDQIEHYRGCKYESLVLKAEAFLEVLNQ